MSLACAGMAPSLSTNSSILVGSAGISGSVGMRGAMSDSRSTAVSNALPAASTAVSSALPALGLFGGLAFTAALFLQVFIALVDVMLYDLAHDMTAM
jgi:hypothetical protein